MGGPSGGGDLDFLRELVRRRFGMASPTAARPAGLGKNTAIQRQPVHYQSPGAVNNYRDPLAERKALDAYEMTRRSAARKPISGFNYMGWDQGVENLPSSMRPGSAGFSGQPGPSGAGLSPNRPQAVDESSNSGFDYLSPIDRARAIAAAQRGR
jgi:hypothetical protein